MNYKLLAELLVEKNNSGLGLRVMKKIGLSDLNVLIPNMSDLDFLKKLRSEFKNDEPISDNQMIIELINKRIAELMLENYNEDTLLC